MVPQGSALAPLLFLIYESVIFDDVSNNVIIFAEWVMKFITEKN